MEQLITWKVSVPDDTSTWEACVSGAPLLGQVIGKESIFR